MKVAYLFKRGFICTAQGSAQGEYQNHDENFGADYFGHEEMFNVIALVSF